MLDDLVDIIRTLQTRISSHDATLRENETRTRMALIDPLLQVLGWDTADPSLVTPEYNAAGKADYALLRPDGRPAATIEAKKLGESLDPHRMQMLNYSNAAGVLYAGLTDGNRWELYEVFKQTPLEDRRILDVSIANNPPHQTALQLLLLWRPNLASGRPLEASKPIVVEPPVTPPPPLLANEEYASLADFRPKPGQQFPSTIHFPNGETKSVQYQRDLLVEVAEYLIRIAKLTNDRCPIGGGHKRNIVHSYPQHKDDQQFSQDHKLSNGLFLETKNPAPQTASAAQSLLRHLGEDAAAVRLEFN